jgi:hypothetical protein
VTVTAAPSSDTFAFIKADIAASNNGGVLRQRIHSLHGRFGK